MAKYTVRPRLNEILKERNMTQKEIADKAHVPQAFISRFDRSENHNDSNIYSVAKALNLSIDDLFEEVMLEIVDIVDKE